MEIYEGGDDTKTGFCYIRAPIKSKVRSREIGIILTWQSSAVDHPEVLTASLDLLLLMDGAVPLAI